MTIHLNLNILENMKKHEINMNEKRMELQCSKLARKQGQLNTRSHFSHDLALSYFTQHMVHYIILHNNIVTSISMLLYASLHILCFKNSLIMLCNEMENVGELV